MRETLGSSIGKMGGEVVITIDRDPNVSLIKGNEKLNTIPKKESNEFIKPSVEDLVPIVKEKVVTFSNLLFNLNDDFISSDDESLSDEDVLEDNRTESKDSYDSNLDEPDLLVTPLSDANKDECFDSGGDDDEINVLDCEDSYYDFEGDILYLESFLNDDFCDNPSNSDMNLVSDSSNVCLRSGYEELPLLRWPLQEYSLLPRVDSPLCSVVLCIVRI
nr:hypothetical protein [Tanacetum cinerariifolium]